MGHVEQQLTVLLVNFRDELSDFAEETHLFFVSSVQDELLSCLSFAQIWQRRWFVSLVEQLVKGNFQGRRESFQGLERRNGMAVLHSRDVTAQQSRTFLDVAL